MIERHLTIDQVAEQLSVDPKTVKSWIQRGELRACNLGRSSQSRKPRWRVAESDLAAFLATRRSDASDKPTQRRRAKRSSTPQYV